MRDWVRVLICTWALWSAFVVDHQYRYAFVKGPMAMAECKAELARQVPYEKKHGVLRYYAPDPTSTKRIGCFPTDYDPRDE